jgi:nicotinamide riboside kinase
MTERAFVIGIVGAESSGKTQLARALQARLTAEGQPAALVSETLREFCDRHRRTPRIGEQAAIAAEQTRRIDLACETHAVVVADTTALMTAVYSEFVFGDTRLYAAAQAHRRCDLTLLTALDLPWQPDGLQRDGAQVRAPVDALVRTALLGLGQPFAVVSGTGEARLASAWRALQRAQGFTVADAPEAASPATWHGRCERCGDPACERRLLPSIASTPVPPRPPHT